MADNNSTIKIDEHLRLAHACAARFRGRGIEYDDLYQAGCMGLVKAARGFDSERGCQFSTYAVPVILGEIKLLFRKGGSVTVSRSMRDLARKAERENEAFVREYGHEPRIEELATIMGVEAELISQAVSSTQQPLSLNTTASDIATIIDIPIPSDEDTVTDRISLEESIATLDTNDRAIIHMRFYENKTQAETARALGMTQVRISRREKVILQILRRRS